VVVNAGGVTSVAGKTGAVTLVHTDITDWTATLAPYALTTAIPAASTITPIMDGAANVGTGTTWARADHVHPSDTSRYAATNPASYQTAAQVTASLGPYALTSAIPVASSTLPIMDGSAAIGSGTTWAKADHIHPSDTSRAPIASPVFTGTVTLPADPASGLQAATKQYVDNLTAGIVVSDTAPASPKIGTLWWDSVGGQLYVWYNDGNSSQWVVANNSPGSQGAQGPTGATGAQGPTGATGAQGPAGTNVGVIDGSNAPAGIVGEYLQAVLTSPNQITLGNNIGANVVSLTLTAGDWDVEAQLTVVAGTATVWYGAISTTSATIPAGSASFGRPYVSLAIAGGSLGLPRFRYSITASTTVYLVAQAAAASGGTAYGYLSARRVR
jgi:hypothetical protein